jgi:hypothetical protein
VDAAAVLMRARTRAGLTQAQLAARANTSQPVISAYEHGRRDPSVTTLRRLIAATGAELDLAVASRDHGRVPRALTDEQRAARLVDVLLLADAIPNRRRRPPLAFPRLAS